MRAIERTAKAFVTSVTEALPAARIEVVRSKNRAGRSTYVFIHAGVGRLGYLKVRISDHPVGMRRALSGDEALFVSAGAKPSAWAVWLGDLCRRADGRASA